MKRLFLFAAMAAVSLGLNAQVKLNMSTYSATDLDRYDGRVCDVTTTRYMFTGWNTIALPFSMSTEEMNATFGPDCRLEKLVGVENQGSDLNLCFMDCKSEGIVANTPYILYYTGATTYIKISKEALVVDRPAVITLTTSKGEEVTMTGAKSHIDGEGLYGVLAADNAEARFVSVGTGTTGFYPTRCYIQLPTHRNLFTTHLKQGETTSIQAVAHAGELVDVYSLSGAKVASQLTASQVAQLRPAIYVVKGQKVIIK
ncbi:MAG: hypothetical protein K6G08_10540 [Prevotella sp.]|nr:hypothetical protein [Prevotella sp.]